MEVNVIDKILEILESKYKENGYITSDEVLRVIEENNISIFEVDKITNKLLLKGVIIIDDSNNVEENEIEDWSHLDYDSIYRKVISIDTELQQYINLIKEIKPPQRGEEKTLLIQAKEENRYAKDRIIEMYLKNVVRIALDYYNRYGVSLSDCIEIGNIGLIKALYKIDISTSDRFSIYMYFRIKTEIERKIIFSNNAVYFPVHIKEKIFPMLEIIKKHDCSECTEDTNMCKNLIKEIKEKTNMSIEEIKQFDVLMQDAVDIDEIDEEYFTDNNLQIDNSDNDLFNTNLENTFESLFETLTPREAEVLKLRYGMSETGSEKTLNEVGEILGVTRERVRQIEAKALKKLRHPSRSKKLRDYME